MAKTCKSINCDNPVFSNLFCKYHQNERLDSKWLASLNKCRVSTISNDNNNKVQTPAHQIKPLKKSYIKPISDKKALELKEYRLVRDKFFKDSPICQFDGCTSKDIQLHHAKGRLGSLLSDVRYFRSLCATHHRYVETHPLEAKQMGLSLDRLSNIS